MIKIPEQILSASFLTDERLFEEYKGRVKADFDNAPALNVLSYNDGIVKGYNSFAGALINYMIKPQGIRVSTQADLEKIIATNALSLQGHYTDTALVLRSEDDPNKQLAKDLATQVKARGYKLKSPLVIPLTGVEVVKDKNSEYGLAFKLTDDAQIHEAPQLIGKNDGQTFSATDAKGIPNPDGKGTRTLYTRESGLSRLYLSRDLSVDSGGGDLSSSGDYGRVVLVRGEAADVDFWNKSVRARKSE